jgi:hypothetical protein
MMINMQQLPGSISLLRLPSSSTSGSAHSQMRRMIEHDTEQHSFGECGQHACGPALQTALIAD